MVCLANNNLNTPANGGNAIASLLLGVPASVDFRPALFTYNYQWDSYAAFVQNDWKIRPNLTLNLGFRYALQMPRTEDNNLQGVLFAPIWRSVKRLPTLSAGQLRPPRVFRRPTRSHPTFRRRLRSFPLLFRVKAGVLDISSRSTGRRGSRDWASPGVRR